MRRFDQYLYAGGIDPLLLTVGGARLPEEILERSYGWLVDAGYSRGTIETYMGGVKAFWCFATAKRLLACLRNLVRCRSGGGCRVPVCGSELLEGEHVPIDRITFLVCKQQVLS